VYLIMPTKLHPFWYSPLLPVFFFLSAICVGLAMTIFESTMSSKHFGRELELPILQELGRVLMIALCVYGVLRLEDLLHRGMIKALFTPGYEMYLFWVEAVLAVILPLALLTQKTVRSKPGGLYLVSISVVLGFITNRLNVSLTGMETSAGLHYLPKWTEFAITAAIIAVGFFGFAMAVKYLPIFPEHHDEPKAEANVPAPVFAKAAAMSHAND